MRSVAAAVLAFALGASPALAQAQQKPLSDKDNPQLIGKRDINKGQIQFYSLDREAAVGRQLAAEIDRSSRFVNDPLVTEYVNRVAQNIVINSDAKVPFAIRVIDSTDVNAFALPGGHLYVHRGLIEAADNEAELAGVIAHEVAHVTARHGMEQASKGELFNIASIPLIFLGGLGGYIAQQAFGLAVPLGFLKFSRGAEKEADRLGAQYMWAAGYDPNAMISFFEKLQAKEKNKPGTLAKVFSTHPMTGDRIKEVTQLVARFPERGEYQLSSSEFGQIKSRVLASSSSRAPLGDRDNGRPTLKRRPTTTSDPDDDANRSNGDMTPDRPTLKRRPDDAGDAPSERPTLERSTPASPPESGEAGRPTLKRNGSSSSTTTSTTTSTTPTGTNEAKSESSDRTELKRTTGSTDPVGSNERPTLKRKPETNEKP
jgi:predicted Zn-dependent protease